MTTSEAEMDWRDRVLADYRAKRQRRDRGNTVFARALNPIQMTGTRVFVSFVDRAARKRNVNRSTYMRRAIALMTAADLGIDVRIILNESPRPGPWGVNAMRTRDGGARDEGLGIEDWCGHPGCDGEHLRPSV